MNLSKSKNCHLQGSLDVLSLILRSNRVQGIAQNMAPQNTEYFKLKKIEKEQEQEGLSDLPLKQVLGPSWKRCWRKGISLFLNIEGSQRDSKRNLNQQALLNFTLLTKLSSHPFSYHIFPQLSTPSNLAQKCSGSTASLGPNLFMKAPVLCETYINLYVFILICMLFSC